RIGLADFFRIEVLIASGQGLPEGTATRPPAQEDASAQLSPVSFRAMPRKATRRCRQNLHRRRINEADATRPAAVPVKHREIAGSGHGPEAHRAIEGMARKHGPKAHRAARATVRRL